MTANKIIPVKIKRKPDYIPDKTKAGQIYSIEKRYPKGFVKNPKNKDVESNFNKGYGNA
tara:strand:+ start:1170 stop:1346 length:177 start_codon:yes stop_codon:yes gene_type:complete